MIALAHRRRGCDAGLGRMVDPLDKDATAAIPAREDLKAARAATQVLRAGDELGRRFRIVRLLGRGGMGEVYEAHDRELDRHVAIKTIEASLSMDADTLERFKREIRLATQVTHKNVLRVFDLAEADGLRFLTMQLVEGEGLHERLLRTGKLPLRDLLELARPMARGVAAAHELGVVHRDLKPQNVLLDRTGGVYVADFGLAVSIGQATNITHSGQLIGSPAYMSPEQVTGEPIDATTDVYALGVILYRMATGILPFKGGTQLETMSQRLHQEPPPLSQAAPEMPDELASVIHRCLQRAPKNRYPSASELVADLDAIAAGLPMPSERSLPELGPSLTGTQRGPAPAQVRTKRPWRVAGGLGLTLVAAASLFATRFFRPPPTASLVTSSESALATPALPRGAHGNPVLVLVAATRNQTGDPAFDGVFEAVISALLADAINAGPADPVGGSVAARKHRTPGAEDAAWTAAARDIGAAGAVLTTLSKEGAAYHATVRVVDPKSGHVWVEHTEDATTPDGTVLAMTNAAMWLRDALGDASTPAERTRAARAFRGRSLAAVGHYSKAEAALLATGDDETIREAEATIALDPSFALARIVVGIAYQNVARSSEAERAFKLAFSHEDALLDHSLLKARSMYFSTRHDAKRAIAELEQIVERFPGDKSGVNNLAVAYLLAHDPKRAEKAGQEYALGSPSDIFAKFNLALFASYAGDFDVALTRAKEAAAISRDTEVADLALAFPNLGLGNLDDARAAYGHLATLGGNSASRATLGFADLALYEGRYSDAAAELLDGIAADRAAGTMDLANLKMVARAQALLAMGRKADALREIEPIAAPDATLPVIASVARIYASAQVDRRAATLATALAQRLDADSQAYAEIIRGEIALHGRRLREAVEHFDSAFKLADTWLGHFDHARAYVELGLYPEAASEIETCTQRKGEALALFLDDEPTARYWPETVYYSARAKEGLGSADAADEFRAFIKLRPGADHDPLIADARKRAHMP